MLLLSFIILCISVALNWLRAIVMHQSAPSSHTRQLVCVLCRRIGCLGMEEWANERWEELLEHGRVIDILLLLRKDKNRRREKTELGKLLQSLKKTKQKNSRTDASQGVSCLSLKSRDWDAETLETEDGFSPDLLQFTHMHAVRDKEAERNCVMYCLCQETDVGLVGVVFIGSPLFPEPFPLMTKANSPRRQQFLHQSQKQEVGFTSYLSTLPDWVTLNLICLLHLIYLLLFFSQF